MFIIYDLIFLVIAVIYIPVYLFKKKFHRGLFARLGFLPGNLTLKSPFWIHAVSVGEAMAVRGLVEGLRTANPGKTLVISTVTATGNKIAQTIVAKNDFVTYLPLDFSFIVRSVIDRINPCVFIIAETEIWPNLISYLHRKKVPIAVVNCRISDASYRGYSLIKFLIKPVLRKVSLFCTQTERDAQRLERLGVARDKIAVTGNMKFDLQTDLKSEPLTAKRKLDIGSEEKLIVAGSTHPKEEEIILGAYKELSKEFPGIRLLIAPRHPERNNQVAQIASQFGFRSVFVSALPATCPTCTTEPVFILDTVGELVSFYRIADIVFVGGSLIRKGGHNILEPATLAKPILFGPHMFNFRDIADLFLSRKAAIMVYNQEDLKRGILDLLNDPAKSTALAKLAQQLVLENQGATRRSLDAIAGLCG